MTLRPESEMVRVCIYLTLNIIIPKVIVVTMNIPPSDLTLALASLAASASAAIALCNCTGSRTSFLGTIIVMRMMMTMMMVMRMMMMRRSK